MAKGKGKGKGRGWHGDSAGHSRAARKGGGKGGKTYLSRAGGRTTGTKRASASIIKKIDAEVKAYKKSAQYKVNLKKRAARMKR